MAWIIVIPKEHVGQDAFAVFRDAVEVQVTAEGNYKTDLELRGIVERRVGVAFAAIRLDITELDSAEPFVDNDTTSHIHFGTVLTFKILRSPLGNEAHLVGAKRHA